MGYESNLIKLYKNIDVLIFPNEDYAVGRPVFEAGFLGYLRLLLIKIAIRNI